MMCALKSMGIFFTYSPKRSRQFESSVAEYNDRNEQKIAKDKICLLCDTRWVDKHTCIKDTDEIYEPLLDTFEHISTNCDRSWNSETVTQAIGLNSQLRTSQFICSFKVNHCKSKGYNCTS